MWKNRNVWIILLGEFVAGLGLWVGIIGNLEFMQKYVPSDFHKSLILFAGLLAGVMVGPLAGRLIDSVSKKKVLLYAGLGRMLSVSFMFFAIYYGEIFWMVLFMIALQLSAAFYFPALQSVIPLVVKDNDLLQMNGIHMNVSTIARVLGTAIAGAMLVVMSLNTLYLLSMVAYGLLFLSTYLLTITEDDKEDKGKQKNRNKKSGFTDIIPIIRNIPIAMMALILTCVPLLFIGGINLMVINISELQGDPTIKGLLYAAEGICFMAGTFLVKRISEGRNEVKLMLVFAFVIAIAELLLFFGDSKMMSLISFGLLGVGLGCFFPIAATIFQTRIPKEYHGRFFSFRNMLDRVLFQIVLLGTGLFLDTIGLQKMVLVFGGLSLLIVVIFGVRYIRTPFVEETEENEKDGLVSAK
ncbi:MFS transporter [Litchfieldia salsa]|uniref:Major Facilitator Superfamily protein n=1 Tax=Litchfieldia salsa TaxID=930152 RepID=A0A1H0TD65_9BACI|nr:MFS transporter [Litchfieldia salsa]SDP51993.1 Major Facilitator Superfamily protein [Litchfieldia salsa]